MTPTSNANPVPLFRRLPRYITTGEAARRLGVDRVTIRRWCSEGRLSFFRTLGGHRRVALADIEAIQQLTGSQR